MSTQHHLTQAPTDANPSTYTTRSPGHGRRLTAAFEALEAAVESDVALVISVVRLGNQVEGKSRGRVESVVQSVERAVARGGPRPRDPGQVHQGARTQEERIHRERRELGVDHALVGGVLARRWGLPNAQGGEGVTWSWLADQQF